MVMHYAYREMIQVLEFFANTQAQSRQSALSNEWDASRSNSHTSGN